MARCCAGSAFLGGEIPQIKSLDDILALDEHAELGDAAAYQAVGLRPYRATARVTALRLARVVANRQQPGLFTVFSEVAPMDRDAMLAQLAQLGVDTSVIDDSCPDPLLAEWLRSLTSEGSRDDDDDAEPQMPQRPPDDNDKAQLAEYAGKLKEYGEKMMARGEKMMARYCSGGKMGEYAAATSNSMGDDAAAVAPKTPSTATLPMGHPAEAAQPGKPPAVPGPTRHPSSVTMKYAEIRDELTRDIKTIVAEQLGQQLKPVQGKIQELNRFAEARVAAEKAATVKARLDALVQQGKVLPAERDAGLDEIAYGLDTVKLHKFSEGGKEIQLSAFDRFFKVLEARPARKFAEIFRDPVSTNGQATGSQEERQTWAKETYTRFSENFKLTGTSEADFVNLAVTASPEEFAATKKDWDARR